MNERIDKYQIIKYRGKPLYVLVPYDEFLRLIEKEEATIPHEVVGLAIKNGWNLLKAWRKYLGLTQKELAKRAGVTQAAISQLERSENHRTETLEKIAKAMGLKVEQLIDEDLGH
ncbi:helix-turn-helix domain-containing protein [Thermodesulfatator atlanticus]